VAGPPKSTSATTPVVFAPRSRPAESAVRIAHEPVTRRSTIAPYASAASAATDAVNGRSADIRLADRNNRVPKSSSVGHVIQASPDRPVPRRNSQPSAAT
jgi:hypothetical protein